MLELLSAVEAQRGIPMPLLIEAVEEALTAAARIELADAQVAVSVDRQTGATQVFTRRIVVDNVADPVREIAQCPGYELGDFVDTPVAAAGFSRLAALTAREVVSKRVLEFERERVYSKFQVLEGTLVHGLVQRCENGHVYALVDRDNEALLSRDDYDGEPPAINDWVYVVVETVRKTARGPAILLSRASARFVAALLPGWNVAAVARDPGTLTLVAVILPDGAAGPPPHPLTNAILELGDPIVWCPWSADPASFVASAINALGNDCPFVMVEPNGVIVAPIPDAHVKMVADLTGLRILPTDDIVDTRAALEAERLSFAMEHTILPNDHADALSLSDAQMAELIRFRDEHQRT
jgi:N utilization substance protein A